MATWEIRLRVRCSKPIGSDDATFDFNFDGRQCRLRGSPKGSPLRNSKWWIITSTNFDSKSQAEAFGIKLGRALRLDAVSRQNGLDFGNNQASGGVGQVVHDAVAGAGGRVMPNVHGLLVFEAQGLKLFPDFEADGTVSQDPNIFVRSINTAASGNLDWDSQLEAAVDLVSRSNIAVEPLTQAVLSVAALEHLAVEKPWTPGQVSLLTSLRETVKLDTSLDDSKRDEVVQALGQLFTSIRQRVRKKLVELGFEREDLRKFDKIYGLRSGIFHGSCLDTDRYQDLAVDARTFSTRVVMAAVNAKKSRH